MNHTEFPPLEMFHCRLPLQLRFNDVDVLGHVNNTVYFSFYDTGKANYFTEVFGRKMDWHHIETVIANIDCAYIAPIYFSEHIEVLTTCISISEKSFRLLQMIRETETGQVKSICETVMVSFDPETGKTQPLSSDWKNRIIEFEGRDLHEQSNKQTQR